MNQCSYLSLLWFTSEAIGVANSRNKLDWKHICLGNYWNLELRVICTINYLSTKQLYNDMFYLEEHYRSPGMELSDPKGSLSRRHLLSQPIALTNVIVDRAVITAKQSLQAVILRYFLNKYLPYSMK